MREKSFMHTYLETVVSHQLGGARHAKRLFQLNLGQMGERLMDDVIESVGLDHVLHMKNMRLDIDGLIEIDSVLIFASDVLILDAKCYTSETVYDGTQWVFNGMASKHDITQQLHRAYLRMAHVLNEGKFKHNLHRKLYFANPYNLPSFADNFDLEHILLPQDIIAYLESFETNVYQTTDAQFALRNLLQKYADRQQGRLFVEDAYLVSPNDLEGCRCPDCFKLLAVEYKRVTCACGYQASKQEAVCSFIHDYGVLHYDEDLDSAKLKRALAPTVSAKIVQKVLDTHFKLKHDTRPRKYHNPRTRWHQRTIKFPQKNVPKHLY